MRALWIMLVASLVVNVLLVGVVGGAALSRYGPRHAAPPTAALEKAPTLRGALKDVPPAERQALRRKLLAAWTSVEPQRRSAQQARETLLETVEAEPYDVAAVKTALAKMRSIDAELSASFHEAAAEGIATLAPDKRRAWVLAVSRGRMMRPPEPPGPWRRSLQDKDDPSPPPVPAK
jgi:uncharacterized membrane protein